MAEAQLQYVLSVMNHAGLLGVNWEAVAAENGIGYGRNASTKFKDLALKHGYTFQRNHLVKTENAVPETPTKPKAKAKAKPRTPTPRKPATASPSKTSSAKKRKIVKFDDEASDGNEVEQNSNEKATEDNSVEQKSEDKTV